MRRPTQLGVDLIFCSMNYSYKVISVPFLKEFSTDNIIL